MDGAGVLQRADCLAELAIGLVEPDSELVENRVYRMRTIQQVFAEGEWLTAEPLNALQATPPANKAHPASDWKRRGRVFSVNCRGKEYFTRYRFDALYQPLPIIKEILVAFGEVADSWHEPAHLRPARRQSDRLLPADPRLVSARVPAADRCQGHRLRLSAQRAGAQHLPAALALLVAVPARAPGGDFYPTWGRLWQGRQQGQRPLCHFSA